MRSVRAILLLFLFAAWNLQAQVKMYFASQTALEKAQTNKHIDVYEYAATDQLLEYASQHNLFYKKPFEGLHALRLSLNEIRALLEQNFVEQLDLNPNKGEVLSNNSVKLTKVLYVKEGFDGIPYSGKGVLLGIIDAGIDFNHPDFQDDSGKTRILRIWDQNQGFSAQRTPSFGYGQAWTFAEIDSGLCTHGDNPSFFGVGNVSGSSPETYNVIVTDSNGCKGSDSTQVFFELCAGTSELLGEHQISIFPNPSSASIRVHGMEEGGFKLFNLRGQMLSSGVCELDQALDFGELPSGSYVLEIQDIHRLKLVLE